MLEFNKLKAGGNAIFNSRIANSTFTIGKTFKII